MTQAHARSMNRIGGGRAATMRKSGRRHHIRVRLTPLGKGFVGLLCFGVFAGGFGLTHRAQAQPEDTRPQVVHSYVVGPGDSLWKFAQENLPEGQSVDEYMIYLAKLNHLTSTTLVTGQRIVVPESQDNLTK